MHDSSITSGELEIFIKTLGDILRGIGSLENLEIWLKSQPFIVYVSTAEHLIKTEPPQKEVSTTFRISDGSTVTKTIDVILYPDQTVDLARVHEP